MARDIAEAHVLVTVRTFERLKTHEMDKLQFELDRRLRSIRGNQPALDATAELQLRHRRLQRLTGALMMMRAYRQGRRR
jgi:hypothetical protein